MNIDRTISFRQDMIDLILAGKKTVTIRPIKPQPEIKQNYAADMMFYLDWNGYNVSAKEPEWILKQYPHGQVGDIVAIRERPDVKLKITGITVDWLHVINRDTWIKDHEKFRSFFLWKDEVFYHWQSFYAGTEYEWVKNPWVWIIEFELEKKGESDENQRLLEET